MAIVWEEHFAHVDLVDAPGVPGGKDCVVKFYQTDAALGYVLDAERTITVSPLEEYRGGTGLPPLALEFSADGQFLFVLAIPKASGANHPGYIKMFRVLDGVCLTTIALTTKSNYQMPANSDSARLPMLNVDGLNKRLYVTMNLSTFNEWTGYPTKIYSYSAGGLAYHGTINDWSSVQCALNINQNMVFSFSNAGRRYSLANGSYVGVMTSAWGDVDANVFNAAGNKLYFRYAFGYADFALAFSSMANWAASPPTRFFNCADGDFSTFGFSSDDQYLASRSTVAATLNLHRITEQTLESVFSVARTSPEFYSNDEVLSKGNIAPRFATSPPPGWSLAIANTGNHFLNDGQTASGWTRFYITDELGASVELSTVAVSHASALPGSIPEARLYALLPFAWSPPIDDGGRILSDATENPALEPIGLHLEVGNDALMTVGFQAHYGPLGQYGYIPPEHVARFATLVANANTGSHSTYAAFEAFCLEMFAGKRLLQLRDGLHEIGGDEDAGQPIEAAIYWAPSMLGSDFQKNVPRVDVCLAGGAAGQVVLLYDDQQKRIESLRQGWEDFEEMPIKFPIGISGGMIQVGFENNGAAFAMVDGKITPVILSRRGKVGS